jgi:hypothetical protein
LFFLLLSLFFEPAAFQFSRGLQRPRAAVARVALHAAALANTARALGKTALGRTDSRCCTPLRMAKRARSW